MGRIGYTYGSEWHLLRYLGYHRNELNRQIEEIIPGGVKVINWMDFHFWEQPVANLQPPVITAAPRLLDAERTGYDFLPIGQLQNIPPEWQVYFPPNQQGGGPQNWDAIGQLNGNPDPCWLLVEAKAHLGELHNNFGGGAHAQAQLQIAFEQVKAGWNQVPVGNWFRPYYQFCNRVASLHFLRQNSINAKLLFVYFCGDRFPGGQAQCPNNQAEWAPGIQQMWDHVGWVEQNNPLWPHVHELFLHACPGNHP